MVPCRDQGKSLTLGLLKWIIFVLLSSGLRAVRCWVCFFSAVGYSAVGSSRLPAAEGCLLHTVFPFEMIFDLGKKMLNEMVKSVPVSLKNYSLSKCPLSFPCQVP